MCTTQSCLFCKEFFFDPGHADYSEVTPGSTCTIRCGKNLWPTNEEIDVDSEIEYPSIRELVKAISFGADCKEFNPDENLLSRRGIK